MKKIFAVGFIALMLSGCSTFLEGPYQSVKVTTWPPNAVCKFSDHPSGHPTFSTVVSGETAFNIRRQAQNYYVTCSKKGYADAKLTMVSHGKSDSSVIYSIVDTFIKSGVDHDDRVHLTLEKL